jgi:hypothetical protein
VDLSGDHLRIAFSAWDAAQDGDGIVIATTATRPRTNSPRRRGLERRFATDGERSWSWTTRADVATALADLTSVAGRED